MDVKDLGYDGEVIPDKLFPPTTDPSKVVEDFTISDKFIPGGPLDETTPSIFNFGSWTGVAGSDNGAFSWEPGSGSVFYSASSFSPRMVFDWISNIGFRDILKSSPLSEFYDYGNMHRISKEEAVSMLKLASITKHKDLWDMVSTPCSAVTSADAFDSVEDCIKARHGLRILAWRFFSTDSMLIYPARAIRLKPEGAEEREILRLKSDYDYTGVRYFNGVVTPLDLVNPFMKSGETIQ